MTRPFRFAGLLILGMTLLLVRAAPLRADPQDIAAVSRSVVRVALVATKDGSAYFVGHGSGVVIAPDKILTNAHVVELTRQEPNIVIGVIPAEGAKSYGARVVAFSPGNDLALVQISGGTLPPATLFAGATQDGQSVVALGYPGNVDRAQGMSLADIIQPMSPVKTSGTLSAGRSAKQYDTLLHTAPMAEGNSGGPLTDACGRVLGINSFGSVPEGGDADYGFAISNREVASFLRQANVQPRRTVVPCRSLADMDAAERSAQDKERMDAAQRDAAAADAAREKAMMARQDAEQSVIAARENYMAVAAVLLALALLAGFGGGIYATRDRPKLARNLAIGAAVLFLGAGTAFFLRPSFTEVDDRAAQIANASSAEDGQANASVEIPAAGQSVVGDNLCRVDLNRSRLTVSDPVDMPLNWDASGCVDGKNQFVRSGQNWTNITLSDDGDLVQQSFDPETGTLRADHYVLDAATLDSVRKTRAKIGFTGCVADQTQLDALARNQDDVRALVSTPPTERIIAHCAAGTAPAAR